MRKFRMEVWEMTTNFNIPWFNSKTYDGFSTGISNFSYKLSALYQATLRLPEGYAWRMRHCEVCAISDPTKPYHVEIVKTKR